MKKIQLTPAFYAHYIQVQQGIHFTINSDTVVITQDNTTHNQAWLIQVTPQLKAVLKSIRPVEQAETSCEVTFSIIKAPMYSEAIVVAIVK